MQNTRNNRKNKVNEFKILAGEMKIIDGKIKPNPNKGEIRFYINSDQLLTFEWNNSDSKGSGTEPLIIFENEWEWIKLPTTKGRVYILQNKTFAEDKLFFWMQYPNLGEDEVNHTIINNILTTGKLDINEISQDEDVSNESYIKKEKSSTGTHNESRKDNSDFVKNFSNSIMRRGKFPSLGKILTKSNITKILDDETVEALIKLLPENQKSKEQLIDNISSPQFHQALESLTSALNSENLMSIIQSFGLDMNKALNFPNGVEAFIQCIIEKCKKK